ncbi:MAG: flagellar basal body L-ring protein FlgH [Candidatus Margulisbacteria bacterium]|nr:flagellar basal body L-ring protein FlgH [Candidatus Margulisiibacteriota bacterium]
MTNRVRAVILILSLFTCLSSAFADSVWSEESASPYSTEKAYKVGDIINILIIESTSAQNKAGTKTDKKDELSAKLTHTLTQLAPIVGTNNQIAAQWGNKFTGSGQTTRTSSVTARISAWVTDVLPNGNVSIMGKHKVTVNDEIQEITITGIVRPKDISGANTIYSYQVANAELLVKGTGTVAEGEEPGWLTRFFNWLF